MSDLFIGGSYVVRTTTDLGLVKAEVQLLKVITVLVLCPCGYNSTRCPLNGGIRS